jgi:hypothetical protein
MKVYVVYVEYPADTPYIVGVYATEALADAARRREIKVQQEEYRNAVWQERPEDDDDPDYDVDSWDVDIHVEEWDVKEN